MNINAKSIPAALAILFAIAACNLPSGTSVPPDAASTAAAQTVQAQLTSAIPQPSATSAGPVPTNTLAVTTVPPSLTPVPATATSNCDLADFIDDITIPDGEDMSPGETFTKTWRLKNIGTCSWTPAYAVVFSSGNSMNGPATQALTGNVNPGQTVDISVALTAPSTTGTYRGNWKLRNASGVLFAQFYVEIDVVSSGPGSGFDLHSQAPSAEWIGGDSGGGTVLTFGGPDTDVNGFAMYKNGQRLEDGTTPSKILETHPKWVDNGVISGEYPTYTIQPGEHFKARIGFLAKADGTCGVGNVIFQLNYKEGGTLHPLDSWTDTCDGSLDSIDVNLNSLAGHSVKLILAVIANGSAGQDWAVWVNPRVEVP
jgi:hypothetical protein